MAYIAVDIGGTWIKVGLIEKTGKILNRLNKKTPSDSYESLLVTLDEIIEWGKSTLEEGGQKLEGLAISQPCATEPTSGKALSGGALLYIDGENPAKDIGLKYDLPYSAENDGNCAALAEVWLGAAKDAQDMALVVCGTGIGGAVVIGRKVIHGKNYCAGEFGMCITGVDEENGNLVSWSLSGSTLALVKDYAKRIGEDPERWDGKRIFELADQNDRLAKACVNRFYDNFVIGLHTVQHVYDPQIILIGGGISSRKSIVAEIEAAMDRLYESFTEVLSRPTVAVCQFQAEANLIGALYHHLNR